MYRSQWGSMATEQDWKRAGQVFRARRFEVGFKSQDALAAALGTTSKWVNNIENGRAYPYRETVVSAAERLLRWERGSINRLVAGEDPIELPPPAEKPGPLSELGPAELVAQISERLTELARRIPSDRGEVLIAGVNHPHAAETGAARARIDDALRNDKRQSEGDERTG